VVAIEMKWQSLLSRWTCLFSTGEKNVFVEHATHFTQQHKSTCHNVCFCHSRGRISLQECVRTTKPAHIPQNRFRKTEKKRKLGKQQKAPHIN